jgi:uncharacterized membrane protein (UPF0127 family)
MSSNSIHKFQVTLMFLIIPLGMLYWYLEHNDISLTRGDLFPGTPIIHIGEIPIQVEIADTPALREKGLSGRTRDDFKIVNGMLFVFDTPDYHQIWMKDMLIPIDVIWISEGLKVIGIEENLQPSSYPKTYRPPSPAKYAVETTVGYADTFGIVVGKEVRLPPILMRD